MITKQDYENNSTGPTKRIGPNDLSLWNPYHRRLDHMNSRDVLKISGL